MCIKLLTFRNEKKNRTVCLGAVHKRRSQGGRELSSADILRTREEGVLQMRTSALFGAKTFEFFEIYGVSARIRGRGFVQCGQGVSIFRDFVRMSFMDGNINI